MIDKIPSLELIWVENEKQRELTYKECLKQNSCEDYIRIIKTLYLRRQDRLSKGQKIIGLDERYLKQAEDLLYGELAIALGIEKQCVQAYITEEIEKQKYENAVSDFISKMTLEEKIGQMFLNHSPETERKVFYILRLYTCIQST